MENSNFYNVRGNKDLASRLRTVRSVVNKMSPSIEKDTDEYTQNIVGACQEIIDQTPSMDWDRWIGKPSRAKGLRSTKLRSELLLGFTKARGRCEKANTVLLELLDYTMSCVLAARGFDYVIQGLPMRSAYGKV
jgi:hypothetical protein